MADAQTNSLVGAWHLVRWQVTYGDGRPPTNPLGLDATGIIAYTPDGWMNASMARAGRKPLSSESARTAPAEERLAAFDSFFSYGGRYRIEGMHVIHSVTIAHNPNMVGTEQRRRMEFGADGTLTLAADDTVPGSSVTRHHRLVWRRENR
ncbi:MAG: lipocalin-like domain-containing protein [Burkholderiales bacterium]